MKVKLKNHPEGLENRIICGVDECGRGCLSGPVVTSAVILPNDFEHELIKDSKKLSEKKRELAYEIIKENAIDYFVDFVDNNHIDNHNIGKSTMVSMINSINGLKTRPNHILIDGNYFIGYPDINHTCVIKGDNLYYCIAASSILAKVTRDRYMVDLHNQYPEYFWNGNKGYGTKKHIEAIEQHGTTKFHRLSFLKNINNLQ